MSILSDLAEAEYVSKFVPKGALLHRFVDTKAARNKVSAQPADFLVAHGGRMWFAEVKSTHEKVSFPFSALQRSQRQTLTLSVKHGVEYLVYVKREGTGQWYRIPATLIIATIDKGKQSLRWDELENHICQV
jgi:penicillin-binding protein-related factor A (putative recombinase)